MRVTLPAWVISLSRLNRQPLSSPPMKVALIAVFTALSLGTNYVLSDIPNVKLMDAFIFLSAFLFGLRVGLASAVASRTIYAILNPWGVATTTIFPFLVLGECFFAVAGALLAHASVARDLRSVSHVRIPDNVPQTNADSSSESRGYTIRVRGFFLRLGKSLMPYGRLSLLFGIVGFQATFAFDVLTNFGTYVFTTSSVYEAFIVGIITGAPLGILHEASNLLFFATVVPMAILTFRRVGLTGLPGID